MFPRLSFHSSIAFLGAVLAGCEGPYVMPEPKITLAGYRVCSTFSEGLAVLQESDDLRYGYVDTSGTIVIPPRFFNAGEFSHGLAAAQENPGEGFGFIDRRGTMVIEPGFDAALPFSEEHAAVRLAATWGFINRAGIICIPARYHNVGSFSHGRARAVVDGLTGFIDVTGQWVVPPSFHRAGDMSEGRAFVCDRSRCGFIDTMGHVVVELQLDDAGSFSSGLAPVRRGDRWGYVDHGGRLAIEPIYDEAAPFREGLGRVGILRDGSSHAKFGGYSGQAVFWGFIDSTGMMIHEPRIMGATSFSEGFSVVRLPSGGLCSDCYHHRIMARDGRFLPGRFDAASPMRNGMAVVRVGQHSYVIDRDGSPHIRFDGSYLRDSTDSVPRITRLKFGYIDTTGAVVIPHAYVTAQPFSEGRAFVEGRRERRSRKRGYIDRHGIMVIPIDDSIAQAFPFTEGRALVSTHVGGRLQYGFIDRAGAMVIATRYADAAPFAEGVAAVKLSRDVAANDWGFIDLEGSVVIPPRFTAAGSFSGGLAYVEWVTDESRLIGGVINRQGTIVVETPYATELSRSLFGAPSREHHRLRARFGFGEGLIPKMDPTTRGWVDSSDRLVVSGEGFDYLGVFTEGRAPVMHVRRGSDPGGWGFVDTRGNLVVPPRFASVDAFSDGRAAIKDPAGRTGYATASGDWAIPPLWLEDAQSFSDGRALVRLGGCWGYLDRTGDFVIRPRYPMAESFSEGLAVTAVAVERAAR